MWNLEQAISNWRRGLAAGGIVSPPVLDELESHLRDDIEQQVRSGVSAEQAFRDAVQRVGTADQLNREFGKVSLPQPRFSRRTVLACSVGFALFVFLTEAWTLTDSEISTGKRLLGLVLVSVIAGFIGSLPILNRMLGAGVRGWALRKAIATGCNFAVSLWVCLLLCDTANLIHLPSGVILSTVLWSLFGAATATVMVIAYGTEPEVLNLWTPEAWQCFELAGAAAADFHHDFIGTEHVLLGLFEPENKIVPNVLRKMGVSRETVRGEIEKIIGNGPHAQTTRPPPCTPRARKAIKLAILEARALGHRRVSPSDVFLGLLREGSGVAALVLRGLGVTEAKARTAILKELANQKDENA